MVLRPRRRAPCLSPNSFNNRWESVMEESQVQSGLSQGYGVGSSSFVMYVDLTVAWWGMPVMMPLGLGMMCGAWDKSHCLKVVSLSLLMWHECPLISDYLVS